MTTSELEAIRMQARGSAKAKFLGAVSDFQRWAVSIPAGERSAEWECDYEDWPALTRAFSDFLDEAEPISWDEEEVEGLMYALARDNECEVLKDELVSKPPALLALAKAAQRSAERDAKWQIADALSYVNDDEGVADLLIEHFLEDEDEYVTRRALIALTRRAAPRLEYWALRAWQTGDEYQRMVALDAMAVSGSLSLQSHLDAAEADGRRHLVSVAREIRERQSAPS